MLSFSDVQKDSINEEQECFDIKMLAPTQTQIKEEL